MARGHNVMTCLAALVLASATASAQNPLIRGQQAPPNDLRDAATLGSKGTLHVRAFQGTEGGPTIGAEPAEIVIYHRNQPVQEIASMLDESGELVIDDLPVSLGIRVLVRIQYAGVYYVDVTPLMNESNREATLEIPVYEITDDEQPHEIVVRQLAGALVSDGIDVAESVIIENTGDRTWMGEPADEAGRRATVRFTLPPDAVEVELVQGFHGWCCTQYTPPTLTVQMPMMPGQTSFRFAYKIPVRSGVSDMRVASNAPTRHSVFVVPATGVVATGAGAEEVGGEIIGGVQTVKFEGGPHEEGDIVGLMLSDVSLPAPQTASLAQTNPAGTSAATNWMAWSVGIGVVVVLAFLTVLVLRTTRSNR